MKKRRFDPTRPLVAFLIFVAILVGLVANGGKKEAGLARALYNDATPLGGKGLRLTLERLGYTTARQTAAMQTMPRDAKIWLILDPQTRFSAREGKALLQWVRDGGLLVFCVRPEYASAFDYSLFESAGIQELHKALGTKPSQGDIEGSFQRHGILPDLTPLYPDTVSVYRSGVRKASGSAGTVPISRAHLEIAGPPGGTLARLDIGKGQVFVAPDALLFTNYALSKLDNAVLVTNLLRVHVRSGAVYFDERHEGENGTNVLPPNLANYLVKPPISYAMLQLLVAGLLFWAFAGRRLGAPVALPDSGPVTRASQFAAAMGALFAKTNRPQAAAAQIGTQFRRRLAHRLGLSPAENDVVLAKRAEEVAGIPFEVTDRLLLQSRAPVSTMSEALRDAQEMELVLRKLEGN